MAVQDAQTYEAMTLRTYLNRHGRRPPAEVATIGAEVAAGIAHLHAHGVTHGDIKPANIMRLGGVWTLADYGLVRSLRGPSSAGGSLHYVPPEGPGGRQADQFALGVVLMEMLTNRRPQSLADFREAHAGDRGTSPDRAALARIVMRSTQDRPDERYGSIDELAAALQHVVVSKRRPTLITVSVTIAVLIMASLAWMTFRHPAPSDQPPQPQSSSAASPISSPTPQTLSINTFDVRHYRHYPQTGEFVTLGRIDADNDAALADDWLSIHATFSAPAHSYLVSLDTDGQVQLRWPLSPDQPPQAIDRLDFPCDPLQDIDGPLFHLDQKPGTQGFLLIASEKPLPPWSAWIQGRGLPTWSPDELPSEGVVLFDGAQTRHLLSTTRGEVRTRPAKLTVGPIDWARALKDIQAVRFVGFRVHQPVGEP